MRCLTKSESIAIMRELGFAPKGSGIEWLDGKASEGAEWSIVDSAAQQTRMAKSIFKLYPAKGSCLIWLREWGVWPSSEFPQLWDEIRERHGEHRWIIDAPGHLFSETEMDLASGMARLVILFGWDALICSIPGSFVVSISHEEFFDVFGGDVVIKALSEWLGPPLP